MSRTTLLVASLAISGLCGHARAQVAYYDPADGNVLIGQLNGEIGIVIHVDNPDDLLPENSNAEAPIVDDGLSGEITWTDFGGFFGNFELGNVLMPSLPEANGPAGFYIGFTGGGSLIQWGDVVRIPEPGVAVLAGTLLLGAAWRRRR